MSNKNTKNKKIKANIKSENRKTKNNKRKNKIRKQNNFKLLDIIQAFLIVILFISLLFSPDRRSNNLH